MLALLRKLLARIPLSQSQATLNGSVVPNQQWLDLLYQLVGIGFGVVPRSWPCTCSPGPDLGPLARPRPHPAGSDLARGVMLAAVIGIPGLLLYLGRARARDLGHDRAVRAAGRLVAIPVLILSAAMNATLEEIVVIGYLCSPAWRNWLSPVGARDRAGRRTRGLPTCTRASARSSATPSWASSSPMVPASGRRVDAIDVVPHTILDAVVRGYVGPAGHVSWLP